MKDCLSSRGYINVADTNQRSWNSSARRGWCNGGFRQAFPADLQAVFKQFETVTATERNASTTTISQDYFALPAAAEVFKGDPSYGQGGTAGTQTAQSNLTEFNALTRFTWYETRSNRVKKLLGSAEDWWERSPNSSNNTYFCRVFYNGNPGNYYASYPIGLSPFGCV